jgi:site-specific recombinase XerC
VEACASSGMKTAQPCDRCACGGLDRTARAPSLGPGRQAAACCPAHLFDWLVSGQVVPVSPAASVRGPRHLVRSGKTAGLEGILEQFSLREGDSLALGRFRVPIWVPLNNAH